MYNTGGDLNTMQVFKLQVVAFISECLFFLCFHLCSSIFLSVGLTRMDAKSRKPFSPKGGKKFTQKVNGEALKVQDDVHTVIFCPFCEGLVSSLQIPGRTNLVGKQAVKRPTNPSTMQRKRTNHGRLQITARNQTNSARLKLTEAPRRERGLL